MYTRVIKYGHLFIFLFSAILLSVSCHNPPAGEHYGFITRLGNDTISVEQVTRSKNTVTIDCIDRFPGVRVRHAEIILAPGGSIRHLVMDIHTPGEPANQRERKVIADVTPDSVHITKTDGTGTLHRDFKTAGGMVVAHVPQLYSLYEIYFAAALQHADSSNAKASTPVRLQQFYIDREFDNFPLGDVEVQPLGAGKATIEHDWLAGTGQALMDSSYRLLKYSGAGTTYKVEVMRVTATPDIKSIAARFELLEKERGLVKQLSVRDTVRAKIGHADFSIDYGRPLMRGRKLLGDVLPYDEVWRTGANAATQFTTSASIQLAGMQVPAGKYTLWTIPHTGGVDLIVNKQNGQWGTEYDGSQNLWVAPMNTSPLTVPVEKFSIAIVPGEGQHGSLIMEWGSFRWTAPIEVLAASK